FEYEPATSSQEEQAMIGTPTLRSIEGTFAAEALGIDLTRPLDAEALAWIEQAFAAHPVLVFPDQDLGPRELAAFGRCFGKPKLHSLVDYLHPEYPGGSWLTNGAKNGNNGGFGVKPAPDWHPDSPYEDEPPRLAILHAKEIPSSKGGTIFADMRAAYDALSDEMKRRLAGMIRLHG